MPRHPEPILMAAPGLTREDIYVMPWVVSDPDGVMESDKLDSTDFKERRRDLGREWQTRWPLRSVWRYEG